MILQPPPRLELEPPRHRFGGTGRKVWAGDLPFEHAARVRGRGWGYRGAHHMRLGALTVEDIEESLKPKPAEPIPLNTVFNHVRIFVMVDDPHHPGMRTATLELVAEDGAVLSLGTIYDRPGLPLEEATADVG